MDIPASISPALQLAADLFAPTSSLAEGLAQRPRISRALIAAILAIGIVVKVFMHPAHAHVLNSIETTVEGATGGRLAMHVRSRS